MDLVVNYTFDVILCHNRQDEISGTMYFLKIIWINHRNPVSRFSSTFNFI